MTEKPVRCPCCGLPLKLGEFDLEEHITSCSCGWVERCLDCGFMPLYRQANHLTKCQSCGWYDVADAERRADIDRENLRMVTPFWQQNEIVALFVAALGVVLIMASIVGLFLLSRTTGVPGIVSVIVVLVIARFLPRFFAITTERVSSYSQTGARFWQRRGGRLAMTAFVSGLLISACLALLFALTLTVGVPVYVSVLAIIVIARYLFALLAQWDFEK